jgi:hypothetical protein
MGMDQSFIWDVFISHASEDKASFVVPLFNELQTYGLEVWFDQFTLKLGDSLRESIDRGLAHSRFGIVVLSHSFFAKRWPQNELNGLVAREMEGEKVILPVWHEITKAEILKYSPPLADKVAANSADGIESVAKRLVEVISPEAFELQHSQRRVLDATHRLREQLRGKDARFDYRIAAGGSDTAGDNMPLPEGVVMSCIQDGLKIDVIATDPQSYSQDPLFATVTLTRKAWENFAEAQKTGDSVEFGPEDFLGVSSSLFDTLGFAPDSTSGGTLTVAPAQNGKSRFRWRIVFVGGDDREEFSFVEFEKVRAGTHEVELRSCAPPLPLAMTFTLRRDGPGSCNLKYSYEGQEIRRVYKSQHALNIIRAGGQIELFDLELDRHVGTLSLPPHDEASEHNDVWNFIAALTNIVQRLDETLYWTSPRGEDVQNTQCVEKVLRTGEVNLRLKPLALTLTTDQLAIAQGAIGRGEGLQLCWETPPSFATILGKTFDLGCYITRVVPERLEVSSNTEAGQADAVNVQLITKKPVRFIFERFAPDSPNPVSR